MSDTVQVQTDTVSKTLKCFERNVYSTIHPQTTMSSSTKSPIKMPCNPPCEKKMMIGRSWWKQMGYNSPCGCCLADPNMKEGDWDGVVRGMVFVGELRGEECCFDDCEETFTYGNNALPLREAKCCDECNSTKVIPARLMEFSAGF